MGRGVDPLPAHWADRVAFRGGAGGLVRVGGPTGGIGVGRVDKEGFGDAGARLVV